MSASTSSILFLHAFPLSGAMWALQKEHFSTQLKVLTPDLRAFGERKNQGAAFSLVQQAEEMVNYLESQNITNPIICGLSMGGYVALEMAKILGPRLKGLILADTKAEADNNEAKVKRHEAIKKIKSSGLKVYAAEFLKGVLAEKSQASPIVTACEKIIQSNDPSDVSAGLVALAARRDASEWLGEILCPTLIIVGADDKVTPVSAAEKLHAGIQSSILKVIPHCGHLANLEAPKEFNSAIEDFLKLNKFL